MPRTLRDRPDDATSPFKRSTPKKGDGRRVTNRVTTGRGGNRDTSGVRKRPTPVSETERPRKNKRRTAPSPKPAKAAAPAQELDCGEGEGRGARFRRALAPVRTALRWVGRVAFAVACVAGVWGAFNMLSRHALTSPYFAVDELVLEGSERLTRAELLEAAGLAVDQNIFVVSPAQAQRSLEALPWVASARVERRLPRRLEVSVVEHHAAALLALSELYLVDRDGSVFSTVGDDDPVDLPVLTGVDEARFRADVHYRRDSVTRAAEVLQDVRAAGLYRRMPPQEIHLGADGGLSLVLGEQALLVSIGESPYGPKLRRLRRVLDRLEARHQRADRVFLDNERRQSRVVVRLASDSPR